MSDALEAIRRLVSEERLGAATTIVAGAGRGDRAVIEAGRGVVAGSLPPAIADDVLADAAELMAREQSRTLTYGATDVFIETIAPRPHLLIFGAAHIAQPLSAMARLLGFAVTVSDARETWITTERFPDVDHLIVGWPDKTFAEVTLDERTYVVLLSHDARFEDPVFPAVRAAPIRYVGALGSRKTARAREERLAAAGWSRAEIDRIHAPIGIDIGAVEPAEVAVSILAEIVRARYGSGTGTSLRGSDRPIHAPPG